MAQHGEVIAYVKDLEFASTLGMRRVIVETDAVLVAKMLSDMTYDRSVMLSL
jgi:ribonuclease HI